MNDLVAKLDARLQNLAAVTDASGRLMYLSHAARQLLGVDLEADVMGRPIYSVLSYNNNGFVQDPAGLSDTPQTIDPDHAGRPLFGNVMAHQSPDGRISCFSYQLHCREQLTGDLLEAHIQHSPPNAWTHWEKSAPEAAYGESFLQQMEISQVFSSLSEPVIVYDAAGNPVMANPAAVEMMGFDPVGMPGKEFRQKKALRHPDGRPVPVDQLPCQRAVSGRVVRSEKYLCTDASGQERIYEFNAVPLKHREKITGAVTVARDETERNRLMDQLETERTALEAIIHNAPEAIIVVDAECRIVMTNPAARRLYTQSAKDLHTENMGPGYTDISPPYDPVDLPLARSVFQGEMIVDHELAIPLPGGQCRHLLVNTAPIRNPKGNITGAVGVFHDITQRKKERMELQRARTELEKRVEERTAELRHTVETLIKEIEERKKIEARLQVSQDKLRHLSHSMLNTLESDRQKIAKELQDSLGASLAAIKFSLEEKLAQMPSDLPGEIMSLESIVSYLRATIKETKRISANLRPTTLDDLGLLATITWFCREFQFFYPHIRVEQLIDIKEEDIDESLKIVIYRILQEAMNNAAIHAKPDTIRLSLEKNNTRIELKVVDDGMGFDPKARLEAADPMHGHGIQGMRERSSMCGGEFGIHSHPGAGTRIHVSLPQAAFHS